MANPLARNHLGLATIALFCGAFWAGVVCALNFDWPPLRFQAPTSVTLITKAPEDIGPFCRTYGEASGGAAGCYVGSLNTIAILNPCQTPDAGFIGRLLCHELGHRNGWPGNHPR